MITFVLSWQTYMVTKSDGTYVKSIMSVQERMTDPILFNPNTRLLSTKHWRLRL